MARIFITSSADGLGHLAAKALINLGQDDFLSPYKFFPVNSYCHAWSCTLYIL
jgi:hypothetical protein